MLAAGAASAQGPAPQGGTTLYSCVDGSGRTITSDRPIAQCADRDQRILGPDGSVRGVLRPSASPEEQTAREERERREALAREERLRDLRRDRLLLARFPDKASHDKVRNEALTTARNAIRAAESRIAQLNAERQKLAAETEFYVGRPLPAKLAEQIEVNESAIATQKAQIDAQQAEIERVNRNYDEELARLRILWSRQDGTARQP